MTPFFFRVFYREGAFHRQVVICHYQKVPAIPVILTSPRRTSELIDPLNLPTEQLCFYAWHSSTLAEIAQAIVDELTSQPSPSPPSSQPSSSNDSPSWRQRHRSYSSPSRSRSRSLSPPARPSFPSRRGRSPPSLRRPPPLSSPLVPGTHLDFRLVFADAPVRPGQPLGPLGAPPRYLERDLGSVVLGYADRAPEVKTHGDRHASPESAAATVVDGRVARTTLADVGFIIGDYILCAIIPPSKDMGEVQPHRAPVSPSERLQRPLTSQQQQRQRLQERQPSGGDASGLTRRAPLPSMEEEWAREKQRRRDERGGEGGGGSRRRGRSQRTVADVWRR